MPVRPVPQHGDSLRVAFPEEHILLITLNRPEVLNTMTPGMEADMKALLDWFDKEPDLWGVELLRVY